MLHKQPLWMAPWPDLDAGHGGGKIFLNTFGLVGCIQVMPAPSRLPVRRLLQGWAERVLLGAEGYVTEPVVPAHVQPLGCIQVTVSRNRGQVDLLRM